MIANFCDAFDRERNKGNAIPREVLDVLEKNELPASFMYYQNDDGEYVVGPRPEHIAEPKKLSVTIDQGFIDEKLKEIPREKWMEYIYRMQIRAPISSAEFGDADKKIPIEKMTGNPLREPPEVRDIVMSPAPFPDIPPIELETVEGDKILMQLIRKPHPSFDEIVLENVESKAFWIRFILCEDRVKSSMVYTVRPKLAETVSDALIAIHIAKGFFYGTLKMGGQELGGIEAGQRDAEEEQLRGIETLWTTLRKLEGALGVSFKPSAELPNEDMQFIAQLDAGILQGKPVIWRHPFDHFHLKEFHVRDGNVGDFIGKEGIECEFVEGPIKCDLLGTSFDVYSNTRLSNIVITNVVWDNDECKGCEVYVADPVNGSWTMARKFMTKAQIEMK